MQGGNITKAEPEYEIAEEQSPVPGEEEEREGEGEEEKETKLEKEIKEAMFWMKMGQKYKPTPSKATGTSIFHIVHRRDFIASIHLLSYLYIHRSIYLSTYLPYLSITLYHLLHICIIKMTYNPKQAHSSVI